jgi:hypothetical protein
MRSMSIISGLLLFFERVELVKALLAVFATFNRGQLIVDRFRPRRIIYR